MNKLMDLISEEKIWCGCRKPGQNITLSITVEQ